MSSYEDFKYFVRYVLAPSILVLGLSGNLMGIATFLRKKFNNFEFGPKNMFVYLLIMDNLYLIQILNTYLTYAYNIAITSFSEWICKSYFFFNYSLDPIPAYLLLYISVDRLVSVKYPAHKRFLRKEKVQLMFLFGILGLNLVLYSPLLFLDEIYYRNNSVFGCNFIDIDTQNLILLAGLVNRIIIPFVLMIICSVLLTYTVFRSRRNFSNRINLITLKKDVKFSITSILLNFVYIFLNLPAIIVFLIPSLYIYDVFVNFGLYIFYMCYAVEFYLILISNSMVRKEFFKMLKCLN